VKGELNFNFYWGGSLEMGNSQEEWLPSLAEVPLKTWERCLAARRVFYWTG